ncbi:MAG: hypothetical protein ABI656_04530 [bacterium]
MHPPNASAATSATNSFEYFMMTSFIWLQKHKHYCKQYPELINFWQKGSASVDQAIATESRIRS